MAFRCNDREGAAHGEVRGEQHGETCGVDLGDRGRSLREGPGRCEEVAARPPHGGNRPWRRRGKDIGETGREGVLAREAGHAATDIERSVKPASIRIELYNGGKQGRYVSDRGRWSLAVSDPAGGAPEQAALPDPSAGDAPGVDIASDAGSVEADKGDRNTLGLNL